jgi:hypothetical protein
VAISIPRTEERSQTESPTHIEKRRAGYVPGTGVVKIKQEDSTSCTSTRTGFQATDFEFISTSDVSFTERRTCESDCNCSVCDRGCRKERKNNPSQRRFFYVLTAGSKPTSAQKSVLALYHLWEKNKNYCQNWRLRGCPKFQQIPNKLIQKP